MNDVYLTCRDPGRNMARYYHMSVQPDLFGEWSLVREWGRIGRGGQLRIHSCKSEAEAQGHLTRMLAAKLKRGYFGKEGGSSG